MYAWTLPLPAMPCASPTPNFPRAAHIAGAVRLADVKPENTRWLWPGRIPLGRVTLLVSDPGLGKSLLTLDIAAAVSTAAPWPDEQRGAWSKEHGEKAPTPNPVLHAPSSVLLLTAEDDLADTVRPRLEATGANCERILAISNVPGENAKDVPRAFALNRDLARLNNLLDALPDCRLLIIDPISAFLGGTNEHANADVRTLLAALATIARERGIAVIVVSHLRKKEGAAIHRTMGSLAFVAAARAAWIICKDPADPNKRLFLPLKNNLAPDVTGLAFTIETSPDGRTPLIRWLPDSENVTADMVVGNARSAGRPDDERQHAINWLQERLAKGARPVRDLKQESDAHGISYYTLRRAFRALGGQAVRQGTFPFAPWYWKLPGIDDQNTGGEFWSPIGFPDDFAELCKQWLPTPEEKAQRHAASQAAQ
jgi:putative DNA primase/helicase